MASNRDDFSSSLPARPSYRRNYRRGYDNNRRYHNKNPRRMETVGNFYDIPKKVFNVPPPVQISSKPKISTESPIEMSVTASSRPKSEQVQMRSFAESRCAWAIVQPEAHNQIDIHDFPSLDSKSQQKKGNAMQLSTPCPKTFHSQTNLTPKSDIPCNSVITPNNVCFSKTEVPPTGHVDTDSMRQYEPPKANISKKDHVRAHVNHQNHFVSRDNLTHAYGSYSKPGSVTILKRESSIHVEKPQQILPSRTLDNNPKRKVIFHNSPVITVRDITPLKEKHSLASTPVQRQVRKDCIISSDGTLTVSTVPVVSPRSPPHRIVHSSIVKNESSGYNDRQSNMTKKYGIKDGSSDKDSFHTDHRNYKSKEDSNGKKDGIRPLVVQSSTVGSSENPIKIVISDYKPRQPSVKSGPSGIRSNYSKSDNINSNKIKITVTNVYPNS